MFKLAKEPQLPITLITTNIVTMGLNGLLQISLWTTCC